MQKLQIRPQQMQHHPPTLTVVAVAVAVAAAAAVAAVALIAVQLLHHCQQPDNNRSYLLLPCKDEVEQQ
jgi:negative regulator of sigma E activity